MIMKPNVNASEPDILEPNERSNDTMNNDASNAQDSDLSTIDHFSDTPIENSIDDDSDDIENDDEVGKRRHVKGKMIAVSTLLSSIDHVGAEITLWHDQLYFAHSL